MFVLFIFPFFFLSSILKIKSSNLVAQYTHPIYILILFSASKQSATKVSQQLRNLRKMYFVIARTDRWLNSETKLMKKIF